MARILIVKRVNPDTAQPEQRTIALTEWSLNKREWTLEGDGGRD